MNSDILQAALEKAFNGVINQGGPAVIRKDTAYPDKTTSVAFVCRYRADDRKCAVGHLIPDEDYQNSFEGSTIQSVISRCPTLSEINESSTTFLIKLQQAHDSVLNYAKTSDNTIDDEQFIEVFKEKIETLAEFYGLKVNGKK